MSSRATSPTPSSKAGDGGSSDSGGVTSLSNDALYKPLQSNNTDRTTSSKNNDDGRSRKKDRHSLSLQTATTLRESSLVSFLASMGNNIKTSHPQECHVYRRLGGSISRYGTGDSGRADKAMRNNIESKLSNRSLVLVGGGIHTYTNTSSATTKSGDVGKIGGAFVSKRIRKRVGGTGVFGCKSHRVRKRAMRKMAKTQSSEIGDKLSTDELDKEVGNVVETLHQMWIKYIEQILSPLQKNTAHKEISTNIPLELRKDIATKVSTSEHIGMPAIIVACPSRRHLVQHRCIVLNETKETYKIAILKSCPIQVKTKKRDGKMDEVPKDTKTFRWKVVLLPKHKTALDVSIPWSTSSTSDLIVVRLET
jgi:hypothetical protein